jgi:4-amino-4-deoxy-L-arabinose transferase-like glycosyltransferase
MQRIFDFLKHHKLALVIVLAISVRIGFLALFPTIFMFEQTGAIHGSTAYDTYAQNLLATGIYGRELGIEDSILPPLYSVLLAAVYGIFGRGGWQLGIFHTLLDIGSIVLLYHIGRLVFKNAAPFGKKEIANIPIPEWIGIFAGLFYALYPYLVFQNLSLNDTALFMLLLHAFVWCMLVLRDIPHGKNAIGISILGGVILGLSMLTRALLPPLAILTALWFLFRLSFWQMLIRLLPVAVVGILITLPWVIRGSAIHGGFVAIALNSGENIFQGANDQTLPLFKAGYDVQWSDPPPSVENITNPYQRNALLLQAGLDWLRDNPEKIPELLWVKFLVHWSIDIAPRKNPLPGEDFALDEAGNLRVLPNTDTQKQDIEVIAAYSGGLFDTLGRPVHILYFGGLLLLAIFGAALSWRWWRDVALLWFVQLSMTVIYMVFHPSTRYRVPSDPLLFLLSVYALVWLLVWWQQRRKPQ